MPNWCQQYGEVRGPNEDLRRFVDAIRFKETEETRLLSESEKPEWDLNQLFPIPQELKDTPHSYYSKEAETPEQIEQQRKAQENEAKYGYPDWYEWALGEWDSKWGACDISVSDEEFEDGTLNTTCTTLRLDWTSAWSPCVGLIRNISKQFPHLLFGFHMTEEANFFAGYIICKNGTVVEDSSYNMDTQPEYPKEDTPTEEQLEIYYEAQSNWYNFMVFEIAEGVSNKMDELMESQSYWK